MSTSLAHPRIAGLRGQRALLRSMPDPTDHQLRAARAALGSDWTAQQTRGVLRQTSTGMAATYLAGCIDWQGTPRPLPTPTQLKRTAARARRAARTAIGF